MVLLTLLIVALLSLILSAIGIGCFLYGFNKGKSERGEPMPTNKNETNSIHANEENKDFIENFAKFINY